LFSTKKFLSLRKKKEMENYDCFTLSGDNLAKDYGSDYVELPVEETASDEYVDYFNDVLHEMDVVHAKKNADYGNNFHKRFKKWGFLTALLRLSDKMERLENIYEKGQIQVKDESVEDTLLDLANYAVMTVVELRNEKKNRK